MWHHPLMRALTLGLPLALALVAATLATTAEAAPNPTLTDKKVRIHVGTDVFGWTHFNPDGDTQNTNVVGFGIGRPTGIDRGGELSAFGLTPGVLSLGAGAVILGGRAVVGGQIAFTVDGVIPEDDDSYAVIAGRGIPYFNWMFGPFGRWRPYLGLRVGVGGAAFHGDDDGSGAEITINTVYPIVGVQGGAHAFVADSVSIDLGVTFDYAAPFSKTDCEPVDCGNEEMEKAGDWLNLAIFNVGLSAWF